MGFKDKIKGNLGSQQPPMISRDGNVFTLRDAAGNERPSVHTLDIVMIDGNANKSRIYRENRDYNKNDPTPPDCFSDNGEAPSMMALKPQSDSCHTCPWAKRGSATSKVDGKPISACADNQKLAVIVAGDPARMVFQLLITPGNLSGFRAYMKTLEGHKYEPEEVVTRLSFVPKSMGVLQFEPVSEVDEDTKVFIANVAGTQQIKYVTGEDDQPIGSLPAPAPQRVLGARQQLAAQAPRPEYAPVAAQPSPQPEPEAAASRQPTREELERELAKLRAAKEEKPAKAKLKAVEAQQGEVLPPEPKGQPDIPAFLRKAEPKPPANSAFGMTNAAAPIPDEVDKLVSQHANGAQAPGLADRLGKAFGLPLRN